MPTEIREVERDFVSEIRGRSSVVAAQTQAGQWMMPEKWDVAVEFDTTDLAVVVDELWDGLSAVYGPAGSTFRSRKYELNEDGSGINFLGTLPDR